MRTTADVSPYWQLFWPREYFQEHDLDQVGNEGLRLCWSDLLTSPAIHGGDAKNLH